VKKIRKGIMPLVVVRYIHEIECCARIDQAQDFLLVTTTVIGNGVDQLPSLRNRWRPTFSMTTGWAASSVAAVWRSTSSVGDSTMAVSDGKTGSSAVLESAVAVEEDRRDF
jgi:hypothetical protein